MSLFFFFNDTATTEIYTLSLHDALPIWRGGARAMIADGLFDRFPMQAVYAMHNWPAMRAGTVDRKSTRLNSSHLVISYAVFCLKKKEIDTLGRNYTYFNIQANKPPGLYH